jgi:hypothetical protein
MARMIQRQMEAPKIDGSTDYNVYVTCEPSGVLVTTSILLNCIGKYDSE